MIAKLRMHNTPSGCGCGGGSLGVAPTVVLKSKLALMSTFLKSH